MTHHWQQLQLKHEGNLILAPFFVCVSTPKITDETHASSLDIYWSVAGDLLIELQATQNYTLAMAVSSSAQIDLSTHYICGFFALHEKLS